MHPFSSENCSFCTLKNCTHPQNHMYTPYTPQIYPEFLTSCKLPYKKWGCFSPPHSIDSVIFSICHRFLNRANTVKNKFTNRTTDPTNINKPRLDKYSTAILILLLWFCHMMYCPYSHSAKVVYSAKWLKQYYEIC